MEEYIYAYMYIGLRIYTDGHGRTEIREEKKEKGREGGGCGVCDPIYISPPSEYECLYVNGSQLTVRRTKHTV